MEQIKLHNMPILDIILTSYFGFGLSLFHFMIMKSLFSFLSLSFISISVISGLFVIVLSFFFIQHTETTQRHKRMLYLTMLFVFLTFSLFWNWMYARG